MPYDSLGRQIGNVTAADMLGPVTSRKTVAEKETEEGKFAKQIIDALNEFRQAFQPVIDATKKFATDVAKGHVDIQEARRGSKRGSGIGDFATRDISRLFKDQKSSFADNFDLIDKMATAGLKKGSLYTHDIHSERLSRRLINQQSTMIQLMVQMSKSMAKMAGDTNTPTINVEGMDEHGNRTIQARTLDQLLEDTSEQQESAYKRRKNERRRHLFGRNDPLVELQHMYDQFMLDPLRSIHLRTQAAAGGIMKHGENNPMEQGLFGGGVGVAQMLGKANEYQRNIAEVAYATQGITLETAKQQEIYRANSDMANAAISSGIEKSKIEEQYLKLLKQGYKSQKDTLKITKTGANLSTMLGSNFEQTVEFAGELHMELGLTADAVNEVSRGMQNTARASQLSGDALVAAARNAKPFLEAMKNSGSLTASTAKNLIAMQASMQKFGVGTNFQELFQGMTGPNAVMGASPENQALMSIMGGNQGLMPFLNGQMANDPKKQLEAWQNLSGYVANIAGKSLSDMVKMGEEEFAEFVNQNWQVNLALKGNIGKEMGELRKGFMAIQESSKSFDMRMADINTKLADAATTDEERVKLMKQQSDLMQNQRGDIAARAASALGKAGSLDEGLNAMRSNSQTLREMVAAAKGGAFGEGFDANSLLSNEGMKEAIKKSLVDSFAITNEALSKSADLLDDRFKVENVGGKVEEAFKTGNFKELAKLSSQLGEAQEAANSANMAETDPARAAAKGINSLNSQFAEYAADALMYLKVIAGANLIQGTGIAALITRGLSAAGLRPEHMEMVFEKFTETFGEGRLAKVMKGVGTGLKEGLGIDKVINSTKGKVGGAANYIGTKGTQAAQLLEDTFGFSFRGAGNALAQTGKNVGVGAKNFVMRNGGSAVGELGQAFSRSPREALAMAAQMQEKVPGWGRFAKMFGAGRDVTAAGLKVAGANPAYGFGSSTAKLAGMSGAESLAKIGTKAALPLTVFMTALEGVGQALKTGARAADIFGVAESNLTVSQKHAAENAGFLTGALNSLTFGIFSHWLGATGSITETMTKFLDKFQLLNVVLTAIMIPLKAVYGIFWGIIAVVEEIAKGIWAGIMAIVQPFNDAAASISNALSGIWDAMVYLMSPLKSLFGEIKGGSSWLDLLIGGFRTVGKVIGGVIYALAMIPGTILKVAAFGIDLLAKSIVALANVAATVLRPFVALFSGVVGGFIDIIWSIPGAIGSLASSIWGGFTAFFGEIGSGIWAGLQIVFEPFSDIMKTLKDTFWDVLEPLMPLWEAVKDFGSAIYEAFGGSKGSGGGLVSFAAIMKGLGHSVAYVIKAGAMLVSLVLQPIASFIKNAIGFAGYLAKAVTLFASGNISGLGTHLVTGFTNAMKTVAANIPSILISGFVSLAEGVQGLFASVVDWLAGLPLIRHAISGASAISGAVGGAWDWVKSWIPGFATGGQITGSGLAIIHEGEMIVPKDQVGNMSVATGGGMDFSGNSGPLSIIDGLISSVFGTSPATTASAASMSDIQARVEQEYAGSSPSASYSGVEMTAIATLTERQLTIMMAQLDELREIKEYLSPSTLSGDGGSRAKSRANTKPGNSPNFYNLPFGGYGGNASKAYINDGVT